MRELRRKKGLTQKQLATLAGTSQQQVQRIEAGAQNARFDLAIAICGALGVRMPDAFPSTELALRRAGKRMKTMADAYSDKRTADELKAAGLDMHPEYWTFRYRLRGGADGDLPISGTDYDRLWHLVQASDDGAFLVFDSGNRRYAINPKHLIFCQFLFDGPGRQPQDDEADEGEARFYLAEAAEPLTFSVEPDLTPFGDDTDWEGGELQGLFLSAETGLTADEWLTFEDGDGERVFIRAGEVTMFSISLPDVDPGMRDDEEDEEAEVAGEAVEAE
ncbi:helix-turn-helix transcriptional regulator [Mesorhizobium sp. SARCC-RB16n]|uniref:helix-turn-helix transcriptional regulator n=1 Tax=Mesorhizobium sp. SARCC-RB16n TaxID=2116687 RepID=UPI001AED439A|nr:helix-turn-helix transcriptional regulator [Mesorhizobium sp. SARCC-RB16n]